GSGESETPNERRKSEAVAAVSFMFRSETARLWFVAEREAGKLVRRRQERGKLVDCRRKRKYVRVCCRREQLVCLQ
ncbi:hypothetical protein A2U01_0041234, partial [Trifolium medium]|nr:hypothetical protein [Trifolium medium]